MTTPKASTRKPSKTANDTETVNTFLAALEHPLQS